MDNAKHFFDELKKGMQKVDQAIEDWDYQDFSPDKRRALLEEQIVSDVADDLHPETNAIRFIQDARQQQLNWSGLSREDALDDYNCGDSEVTTNTSYESKVVIMCTPGSGILGAPDADTLARFINKAMQMEPRAVVGALVSRLQEAVSCWQIRSKVLVLVCTLAESAALAPHYLPFLQQDAMLMPLVEKLFKTDHNAVVRENARRALSLVLSSGSNPMHIAKELSPSKPRRVRDTDSNSTTLASVRKTHAVTKSPARSAAPVATTRSKPTMPPPAVTKIDALSKQQKSDNTAPISPKIARAALASWRRRMSQNELSSAKNHPSLLPFETPVMGMAAAGGGRSEIVTSSASRLQSGQLSAFTFLHQQQV